MSQPEVTINQGKLRGSIATDIQGENYYRFQGIPYARPPLGNLRFKDPLPPEKWSGIYDATKEGDPCYARDLYKKDVIAGSENCLVLNVYTKKLPDNKNKNLRPVLFWIHGGGFIYGSGSTEFYGPDLLITEDVVVVTINYRLGMLGINYSKLIVISIIISCPIGFLSLEDSSLGVPGNAGLKDMIMALKWVQSNISNFSGDPNNVTIFGESAGGAAVHLLFLSQMSRGLFHKAIAQSGCAINPWVQGQQGVKGIASVIGLEGADEKTIYKYLMEKSVEEIYEIQEKIADNVVASERRPFGLVIEEKSNGSAFITEEPMNIMLSGKFNHVPLMTGYTTAEGMCFELFKNPNCPNRPTFEDIIPWFFGYQLGSAESKAVAEKIKKFYYGSEEPSSANIGKKYDSFHNFFIIGTISLLHIKSKVFHYPGQFFDWCMLSDAMFVYGIYVTIMTQLGRSKAPTYLYRVSIESELNFFKHFLKIKEPGVSHCDDVGYLFKHFATPEIKAGSLEDTAYRRFVRLWTNFAKYGNPTPQPNDSLLNVVWKPVTGSEIDFLDIGKTLIATSSPETDRMNFWKKLFADSPAEIKDGKIRGKIGIDRQGAKFYSFQNIPYAAPPLGDLRFKAPQPVEPWTGIKDATKEGNECVSRHLITREFVGSEDCLNLNVYTPEIPPDDKPKSLKPVMFWIHGGIFMTGSNKPELFGPEFLMPEDIVLVTINYRLGILGFLSLEDPSLGIPGNAGFKDMVMALKWVQRNISYFFGDPNNVTVFGESAGAAAAHLLMLSPMTKGEMIKLKIFSNRQNVTILGLLHKVIAQSASALNSWVVGRRSARVLAENLGFWNTDDRKILSFLRNVPAKEILKAQIKIDTADFVENDIRFFGAVTERPSNEEPFLTKRPIDIILSGDYNHVPMILGYNLREGIAFDDIVPARSRMSFFTNMELSVPFSLHIERGSNLSKMIAQKIKKFYFGDVQQNKNQHLMQYCDLCTDTSFLRDVYFSTKHHLKTSTKPIYFYRMSLDTDLNVFKKLTRTTTPGVYHGDDLGYLFKTMFTPDIHPGSIEDVAQRKFTRLWTNFARYSNPTPNPNDKFLNITWKPCKIDEMHFLDIGEKLTMQINPEPERMAFWDNIYQINPAISKL
ncbi:uncharacterized protein BDFB_007202 [Asbolus verrucosus]|uniref:Carboxylesterase type B domain-containing protein n=1 Tax=Asbolus verrucosus TaxID=1661398 RepID=A0A482VGJ3_ASBVE|nr:uncharacterized protein BDFB_007202 [Asbolus verrucosus]